MILRISGCTDRLTILGILMKSMVWWWCSSWRWPASITDTSSSEIIKGRRRWSSRSCRISSALTNGRKLFGVGLLPSMPLHNQLDITKNYKINNWIYHSHIGNKLDEYNDATIKRHVITNDRKVATITFDIILSKTFRKRRENTAPIYAGIWQTQ